MTDTRVADTLLGKLVDGRYRVRDRVARGGMATVYKATDERLERTVALKMIHPTQATDPRFVERFIDEAKAIARLTHPNVVAAYDQGTHQGLPYLVMEYVPGRTLREILGARRRLTPVEALAITEQMLAAIAAAHRAGLVHRDVKPENVLVAESPSAGVTNLVDSVVKVTDFGLAQAVAASTSGAAATGSGGEPLLATVAYVPPELVRDGRADPRSDVYSVGIVLFEMLTGRVPFDGGEPAEVAWQHVDRDVPRASTYVSGMPAVVDDLVARATRREPAGRPSDAGALLSEVQAAREQVTTTAVRTRAADATVVMSAVPRTERPSWARLPSTKARPPRTAAPARQRASVPSGGLDDPDRPPRTPTAAQARRTVLAAFVAVLGLLLVIGGWWFGIGRWMPAPELVGLAEAEAVAEAEALGLTVVLTEPEFSEQIEAGLVRDQDPDGRVLRGGTITITLSRGPERHPVPDIIGSDFEVAKRQLESLGLVVVEGEGGYSNTVPEGRVLAVDPEVGVEVARGDNVTVNVSQGRPPIDVPPVVGKQVDEATRELQQLGLSVTTEDVDSNEPEGQVIAQSPESSTGAEPGDTVQLQVSKGPPTRPVPGVIGQRCQRAIQALEDAGFEVVLGFDDDGRVLLQNPSEGTGLPPGSEVTIWCN